MKTASLVADTVCVLCPVCKEPIPNKANGSFLWAREDFTVEPLECECISCDAKVLVVHRQRVPFN